MISSQPPNNPDLIAINFLPIMPQTFRFAVYRRSSEPGSRESLPHDIKRYKLPRSPDSRSDDFLPFDICLARREGFDAFDCVFFNILMVRVWFLFRVLFLLLL
jgi:hypothetical protein